RRRRHTRFAREWSSDVCSSDLLELPDVESRRGTEILEEAFGGKGAGATGSVVFRAEAGVHDPEVRAAMTSLFDEIESIEGLSVRSEERRVGKGWRVQVDGVDIK